MEEMTLGGLIRSLRKQGRMTQAALAEKVGITDKAVSKWERDISYPDISLFPRLADALGVTVDDLFRRCVTEENSSRLTRIFQMSHDIRTPLHIMLGYAELASRCADDPEKVRRYLKNIRFSGEYLLQVIDHLMAVTREPGGDDAGPSSADVALRDAFAPVPGEAAREYDFSGKRVLLAEDIELNREIAGEILRQTGMEVEFAGDGAECVDMLAAREAGYYDLILMDIQMPNKNGMEATREIRAMKDKRKARIPIVAMTANVYPEDREKAFAAGMDDFAEKPIRVQKLYETLKKHL